MNEYIFDPLELTVQTYLRSVQSVAVGVTRPEEIPTQFIQVEGVGGSDGTISQSGLLAVICWGESRADAMRLAETTRAYLKQCHSLGGLPVYRMRASVPVSRPDPSTGRQRYQFTLDLRVRGRNFLPSR